MISRVQMLCLTILALADVLLGVASVWMMPDRVPVHWNFHGEVDRYGSPWELALILPAGVVLSTGLLMVLPFMGSAGEALQRSRTAYGQMAIAVVVCLIGIHVLVIFRGLNHPSQLVSAMLADVGLLIAVLGNWTAKLRRNPIAGIRTPWTLKSDAVWERTNRLGARLMVAHGLIVLVAALCLPAWAAIAVLMGGLFALVTWSLIYSRSLARAASQ
jgi:uncharacterized membrane protein